MFWKVVGTSLVVPLNNCNIEGKRMNSVDFNKCREFLEYQIGNNAENPELIKAYIKLIENKTEYDISLIYCEDDENEECVTENKAEDQ